MKATIKKLGEVGPGGKVTIDRRLRLLRITVARSDLVFDVFSARPDPLAAKDIPAGAVFSEVVDVPEDENWAYDFFLMESGASQVSGLQLDRKQIAEINAGAYYVVALTEAGKYTFRTTENGVMVVLLVQTKGKRRFLVSTGPRLIRDLPNDYSVIAVLDILGYRNVISTTEIGSLRIRLERLLKFLESTSRLAASEMLVVDSPHLNSLSEAVEVVVVSDTVIIRGISSVARESITAVCRACSLVIDLGLFEGWLFRGAITVGEFAQLDKWKAFIGKALVTAYDLEHQQQWVGCAIDHQLETSFPDVVKTLCESGLFIRYPCPLKKDHSSRIVELVLNWAAYKVLNEYNRMARLKQMLTKAPDASSRQKIKNTIKFLTMLRRRKLESIFDYSFHLIPIDDPHQSKVRPIKN